MKTKRISSSLSCLPDELVLDCLVRVPRRYYGNISAVSKRLRSLLRSPELYRLRSLLHRDPVYVCICERDLYPTDPTFLWFTLRRTTTAAAAVEYQLVPISFPSGHFMFRSSTVAVDSEIYFVGGYPKPTKMWILDTRSGKLRQGPYMENSRATSRNAGGVLDGKIYVIIELRNGSIQEEVFDVDSQTWEVEGVPGPVEFRLMAESNVSLEGKVYAMIVLGIDVYNLRRGRRKENLEKPTNGGRVWCICLVHNVLLAGFTKGGFMWLDTKLMLWKAVCGDVQTLHRKIYAAVMVEYYGKLAVLWRERKSSILTKTSKKEEKIWLALVALDRVGEELLNGLVSLPPYLIYVVFSIV